MIALSSGLTPIQRCEQAYSDMRFGLLSRHPHIIMTKQVKQVYEKPSEKALECNVYYARNLCILKLQRKAPTAVFRQLRVNFLLPCFRK